MNKVCVKCERPDTSIYATFNRDRGAIWMDKNQTMANIKVIFFCDECSKKIDVLLSAKTR